MKLVIISLTLNVRVSAQEDGTFIHIMDRTSRLTTLAQIAGVFLGSPYSSGEQLLTGPLDTGFTRSLVVFW